jgi:uncharacterized membrane protein
MVLFAGWTAWELDVVMHAGGMGAFRPIILGLITFSIMVILLFTKSEQNRTLESLEKSYDETVRAYQKLEQAYIQATGKPYRE